MAKFSEIVTKLEGCNYNPQQAKVLLDSLIKEIKPTDQVKKPGILNVLDKDQHLLEYAIHTDNLNLIECILPSLGLLDAPDVQKAALLAIEMQKPVAYELIKQYIPTTPESKNAIDKCLLRHGNYQLITTYLNTPINYSSSDDALKIAENCHDLAFLLQKFSAEAIKKARDTNENNILHIALQNKNRNVFQYLVNHFGLELLDRKNRADKTPIECVYEDIKRSAKTVNNETVYDFDRLMLLDQVGVDLVVEEYADIYAVYQKLPDSKRHFLLSTQGSITEVNYLNFNGGGVKGQAFLSALEESEKQKLINLKNIKGVGGTSAGAITAGVLSFGFDLDRVKREMQEFDFAKMMENPTTNEIENVIRNYLPTWMKYYQQGAYKTLLASILASVFNENLSVWSKRSLSTSIQQLTSNTTGIFKPTYLRDKLATLLKERIKGTALENIPAEFITFADFHQHLEIFKELAVYGTNLTTCSVEKFSFETTPNMSIIDAIVISSSFPLFFEAPQQFYIETNDKNVRERKPVLIQGKPVYFCDGGVVKNDPVDAFDENEFNKNSLTFLLMDPDGKKHFADGEKSVAEVKSAVDVAMQGVAVITGVERERIHEDLRNAARIVYINTQTVNTLDFHNANAKNNQKILEQSGKEGVIHFLNRRTANQYSVLRDEMITLLMMYGVAKRAMTSKGLVVEIAPNCQLSPQQILRVYAAANDDEVGMLRSIINPNQRDANGITALAIATSCRNFEKTKARLLKAGANSQAVLPIHTEHLPAFLLCGEVFLENTLSDAALMKIDALQVANKKLESENQALQSKLEKYLQKMWKNLVVFFAKEKKYKKENEEFSQQLKAVLSEKETLEKELVSANAKMKDLGQALTLGDEKIKTLNEELRETKTSTATLGQQLEQMQNELKKIEANALLNKKNIRNAPIVKDSLDALKKHGEILAAEVSQLKKLPPSRWKTRQIAVREDKIAGIDEVLTNINHGIEQNTSAFDVIKDVSDKHTRFYAGFFTSRTKSLCKNIIKAEKKAQKIFKIA